MLEAAELVVTGVIFTTVAAAVVAGFGNGISWIPELRELTGRGSTHAQEELYRTAAIAAIVFALTLAAAYGTARLVHRRKEASLVPAGSVWRDVFCEGGEGRPIFVSATLVDGRVVDGYLYSYSTHAGGGDRDLLNRATALMQRLILAPTLIVGLESLRSFLPATRLKAVTRTVDLIER